MSSSRSNPLCYLRSFEFVLNELLLERVYRSGSVLGVVSCALGALVGIRHPKGVSIGAGFSGCCFVLWARRSGFFAKTCLDRGRLLGLLFWIWGAMVGIPRQKRVSIGAGFWVSFSRGRLLCCLPHHPLKVNSTASIPSVRRPHWPGFDADSWMCRVDVPTSLWIWSERLQRCGWSGVEGGNT